jgi:hypothetical protein
MFLKCTIVIICLTLLSAALLELRHRRLELVYQMTTLHGEMDQARKSMWDTQTRIARLLQPGNLEEAIKQADLKLEPVEISPDQTPNTQDPSSANSSGQAAPGSTRSSRTALTNPSTSGARR